MNSASLMLIHSVVGKSGQVAQRFSSSLSSIGVVSQFVHTTEWSHGDLGEYAPAYRVLHVIFTRLTRQAALKLRMNLPVHVLKLLTLLLVG